MPFNEDLAQVVALAEDFYAEACKYYNDIDDCEKSLRPECGGVQDTIAHTQPVSGRSMEEMEIMFLSKHRELSKLITDRKHRIEAIAFQVTQLIKRENRLHAEIVEIEKEMDRISAS